MSNILTDINSVVDILKNDGVIIMPCDTILGLVGRVSQKVHDTLVQIKQRPQNQSFLILLPNTSHMGQFVENVSKKEQELMQMYWPGPLTIVFKKRQVLSPWVTQGKPTIALRYPDFKPLNEVLNAVNMPLFSTSVNVSNTPAATDFSNIPNDILTQVDGVYKSPLAQPAKESTIVSCEGSEINILRQGAVVL